MDGDFSAVSDRFCVNPRLEASAALLFASGEFFGARTSTASSPTAHTSPRVRAPPATRTHTQGPGIGGEVVRIVESPVARAGGHTPAMSKRTASEMDAELMPPPPSQAGASSSRAPPPQAQYLPCKTFQGARPGYFFRLGAQGPGYYLDRVARHAATLAMPPPKRRKNAEELLAEAEAEAGLAGSSGRGPDADFADASTVLDEKALRKLVLAFERRYAANQAARMKHPDAPEKFVDSEVDLDESLRALSALAGYPELYPEFVRLNAVPSILGLLAHDNSDVAAHALELLHELTDADSVESHEEGGVALARSFARESGYELLLQSLERFAKRERDVPEDAAAVHHALGVVENLLEIEPEQAAELASARDGALPRWILRRATKVSKGKLKNDADDADDVRAYAAEVLAILAQTGGEGVKQLLGGDGGIEAVLTSLAPFKSRDPADEAEEEWLENVFDALCALLSSPANRDAFLECEGTELMLLVLRSKKIAKHASVARVAAIKTLDFALTNSPRACARFVEALGLKTAFAAFIGKGVATSKNSSRETEERAVSVIASLFANLEPESDLHDRLCAKFVEDDHAKIDRLVELFFAYAARVENVQAAQRRSTAPGGILEGADEDELYVERLGGGLYTLELLACILGAAFATKHAGIRERTLLQMELMSAGDGDGDGDGDEREARLLRPVRDVLETHAENIGDADGEEEQMRRRMRVVKLIVALGGGREEAAGE